MERIQRLRAKKQKLQMHYKQLMEQAYNFRQTDHELSDISEYRALKLLQKINRLSFLERESKQLVS